MWLSDVSVKRPVFATVISLPLGAAVALFRSVINLVLLFSADRIMRRVSGSGLLA